MERRKRLIQLGGEVNSELGHDSSSPLIPAALRMTLSWESHVVDVERQDIAAVLSSNVGLSEFWLRENSNWTYGARLAVIDDVDIATNVLKAVLSPPVARAFYVAKLRTLPPLKSDV